jgi:hypothetical protein
MPSETDKHIETVQAYVKQASSDVFLYSGTIEYGHAAGFVDLVCERDKHHPNVLLFLTTAGGDPDAAYRMIHALRCRYKKVRLAVVGPCKSAGTLIALGTHELAVGDTGELGPLDVQLAKPDEMIPNSSGLDIFQALAVTTENALDTFESTMLNIIRRSGGSVSTKTAAEIAREFATSLFAPIMAQVDPNRLGEAQRAINIARAYGDKLGLPNVKTNAVDTLVNNYPSHGFVIDRDEAAKLFKSVQDLTPEEKKVAAIFRPVLRHLRVETEFLDIGKVFSHPDKPASTEAANGRHPVRKGRERDLSKRNGDGSAGDTSAPESITATAPAVPTSTRTRRSPRRASLGNGATQR